MYLERLLYPIESLGPGKRIALWLQGCSHHCPYCANPELWETKENHYVNAHDLGKAITQQFQGMDVDGLTVTGGDPMYQPDELIAFLQEVRNWIPDILVYTGYTIEQLQKWLSAEQMELATRLIDVLIDGPYIHEQNDNRISLRGSTNQKIHFWNPVCEVQYDRWMKENGRPIQNVFVEDSLISVGIHNKEGSSS